MSNPILPYVSVILPMRNEGRYIGNCLRSLLRSTYPPDRWEIILADGMSEDHTREEVESVRRETAVPIILVENPRRVTPFGLNHALAVARGDVIIRIDAHAEYAADYIHRCVETLLHTGAENVGGGIVSRPGAETAMGHAIALALAHPFGVGDAKMRIGCRAQEVDTVPFGCFRAEVFQRIGLFDERLVRNQDYEFNQRIRRHGGRIYLEPGIVSHYYTRPTLRALLKQSWSNGFWNALCHRIHPYSLCLRHLVPMIFSLGAVTAILLGVWGILGQMPAELLPVAAVIWVPYLAYVIMDVTVATSLARRHGWRLWCPLALTFPAFHFVNGAGLTVGWIHAIAQHYPWQPEDHIPRWEEARATISSMTDGEKRRTVTVRDEFGPPRRKRAA